MTIIRNTYAHVNVILYQDLMVSRIPQQRSCDETEAHQSNQIVRLDSLQGIQALTPRLLLVAWFIGKQYIPRIKRPR